jgi:DNA-directed RNA polymerase sigma subunit (sigma70/sigma32)
MDNISDDMLRRLDAFNAWLKDVYNKKTSFSALLIDAGFSEAQIEQLIHEHLSEFLKAILDLMDGYATAHHKERNNVVIVKHYGLADGKPQDFYAIAPNFGVCGERIRQLTMMGLNLYRAPTWRAKYQDDITAIARRLLADKSSNQMASE